MISMIMPMSCTLCRSASLKRFQSSCRYANTPTATAYATANAPTSDGVKMPKRMPMTRNTGNSSAHLL